MWRFTFDLGRVLMVPALCLTMLSCAPTVFKFPPEKGWPGTLVPPESRTLPIPRSQVFPRILHILLEMGYQVGNADAELGLVNISRSWYDRSQIGTPELSVHATLLFEAEGEGLTRLRVLPTGRWGIISRSMDLSATVTGAEPAVNAQDTQLFIDQLARRLCPSLSQDR